VLTYCSSDYEIGSTISSGGANNEDHVDGGDGHGDQVLGSEKKKKRKTKSSMQR
jgi:hypothetical protein